MFRVYSPSATEPWPRVPLSIASSKALSYPGLIRALTKYRTGLRLLLRVGLPVFQEPRNAKSAATWRFYPSGFHPSAGMDMGGDKPGPHVIAADGCEAPGQIGLSRCVRQSSSAAARGPRKRKR